MTGKTIYAPKEFEQRETGGGAAAASAAAAAAAPAPAPAPAAAPVARVSYHAVMKGQAFTRDEMFILFADKQQFTMAFTPFCPLHATNVHAAASCPQWQTKLRQQMQARAQRSGQIDRQMHNRYERNEGTSTSRQFYDDKL